MKNKENHPITQLERISMMEETLDLSVCTIKTLLTALEEYKTILPALKELADYYQSPLWLQDFDDDAAGKLPKNLKRGVLSEDAVYDLFTSIKEIQELMTLLNNSDHLQF